MSVYCTLVVVPSEEEMYNVGIVSHHKQPYCPVVIKLNGKMAF